jgi:hypothetical protein
MERPPDKRAENQGDRERAVCHSERDVVALRPSGVAGRRWVVVPVKWDCGGHGGRA